MLDTLSQIKGPKQSNKLSLQHYWNKSEIEYQLSPYLTGDMQIEQTLPKKIKLSSRTYKKKKRKENLTFYLQFKINWEIQSV